MKTIEQLAVEMQILAPYRKSIEDIPVLKEARRGLFNKLSKFIDEYCKQFEPIYQVWDSAGFWEDVTKDCYDSADDKRTVYLKPQAAQIPSEVKEYIESLENALGSLDAIYYDKVKKLRASKPDSLKCVKNILSSRTCEFGTNSCDVSHVKPDCLKD